MMRTTAAILLVCLAATGLAQEAKSAGCSVGLWGENCNNVCIGCNANEGCSQDKGACTGGCAEGYEVTSTQTCQPKCFGVLGNAGCDNGGECVAPNYCICGKSGAQVVGVYKEDHAAKGGKTEAGTQCISLRKDGIKGAFISLVIMVISIGFCGIIEVQRNKGKSRKE